MPGHPIGGDLCEAPLHAVRVLHAGFITTAKALLDRNPDPKEEEIREALGGNLCRCGTYPQHPKAILEAAEILGNSEGGE